MYYKAPGQEVVYGKVPARWLLGVDIQEQFSLLSKIHSYLLPEPPGRSQLPLSGCMELVHYHWHIGVTGLQIPGQVVLGEADRGEQGQYVTDCI